MKKSEPDQFFLIFPSFPPNLLKFSISEWRVCLFHAIRGGTKGGLHSILPPLEKKKNFPSVARCIADANRRIKGTLRGRQRGSDANLQEKTLRQPPLVIRPPCWHTARKKLKWRRVATTIWLHCLETWAPLGVRQRRGKKEREKKHFREKKGGGIGKVRLAPSDPDGKNAILC